MGKTLSSPDQFCTITTALRGLLDQCESGNKTLIRTGNTEWLPELTRTGIGLVDDVMDLSKDLPASLKHDLMNILVVMNGRLEIIDTLGAGYEKHMNALIAATRQSIDFLDSTNSTRNIIRGLELMENIQDMFVNPYQALEIRRADSDDFFLDLDASKLLISVFSNLIKNAAEAGATVVRLSSHCDQNWGILLLQDDGKGIPPDIRGLVWGGYTHGKDGGKGLGMPNMKKAIQDLGGDISFTSCTETEDPEDPKHHGTTFRLSLPRAGTA